MKIKHPGEAAPPPICTPLVGKTGGDISAELARLLPQTPDMIEWRADFYHDIGNTANVVAMAKNIKEQAGNIPLIFTIRSAKEGGNPVPLPPEAKLALNAEIAACTAFEYIDCELAGRPEHIEFLRREAHAGSKKIIASFHQFAYTPTQEILCQKITQAAAYGLDVAKIAVMPRNMGDVLVLLGALLAAGEKTNIPIIAIAMGRYGIITRLAGGLFGSAATFAAGCATSAPGQVNVDDLRLVLGVIEKNMGLL